MLYYDLSDIKTYDYKKDTINKFNDFMRTYMPIFFIFVFLPSQLLIICMLIYQYIKEEMMSFTGILLCLGTIMIIMGIIFQSCKKFFHIKKPRIYYFSVDEDKIKIDYTDNSNTLKSVYISINDIKNVNIQVKSICRNHNSLNINIYRINDSEINIQCETNTTLIQFLCYRKTEIPNMEIIALDNYMHGIIEYFEQKRLKYIGITDN